MTDPKDKNEQTKDAIYRLALFVLLTCWLLLVITPKVDLRPSPLQAARYGFVKGHKAGYQQAELDYAIPDPNRGS
jgi:hypothetical protein